MRDITLATFYWNVSTNITMKIITNNMLLVYFWFLLLVVESTWYTDANKTWERYFTKFKKKQACS